MEGYYCWTAGSTHYHRPVFVPSRFGPGGYTRSACGVISSVVHAIFWILPITRNKHKDLEPCKRCFPKEEENNVPDQEWHTTQQLPKHLEYVLIWTCDKVLYNSGPMRYYHLRTAQFFAGVHTGGHFYQPDSGTFFVDNPRGCILLWRKSPDAPPAALIELALENVTWDFPKQ